MLVNPVLGTGVLIGATPVVLFGIHDRDTAKVRNATYFGLKVFMDAHSTVTAVDGDRYPIRPPKPTLGPCRSG